MPKRPKGTRQTLQRSFTATSEAVAAAFENSEYSLAVAATSSFGRTLAMPENVAWKIATTSQAEKVSQLRETEQRGLGCVVLIFLKTALTYRAGKTAPVR